MVGNPQRKTFAKIWLAELTAVQGAKIASSIINRQHRRYQNPLLPPSSSTASAASAPCGMVHSRGSPFVGNRSVFGGSLEKAARSSRRRRLTPASANDSALDFDEIRHHSGSDWRPTVITVKAISEMRPSPQITRMRAKPLSPEQSRLDLAIDRRVGSRRRVQGEAHRRIPTIASALGGMMSWTMRRRRHNNK